MKHSYFFAVGISLLFVAAPLQARVYHVTTKGTGDGSSWEKAMGSLDDALAKATSGDEIWIAAGTYKPTQLIKSSKKNSRHFPLKDGVSLYGGFAGTEKDKDKRAKVDDDSPYKYVNETILSADDDVPDEWVRESDPANPFVYGWKVENNIILGTENNANHILFKKEELTAPITIDGLTLKGANAMVYNVQCSGGAIYAVGDVTITTCQFIENSCYFTAEGNRDANGAAVYLIGKGNAKIEDCYFERTYGHSPNTQAQGGAVYAENTKIDDCIFVDCVALDAGGAVYIVANCFADYTLLGDEKGGAGGGVYNKGTFVGGIIYNCTSFHGGGIFADGGKIINCTVQNNKSRKAAPSANIDHSSYTDEIKDVINTISGIGVDKANFVKPTTFEGCTIDDKELQEILLANWELTMGSEFIDKGVAIEVEDYTEDIYGNDRVMGKTIDIGACEFDPATAIAPIAPNNGTLQYSYYTIGGQYIGSVCPIISGVYVVKTTNGNKTVSVKKVLVR